MTRCGCHSCSNSAMREKRVSRTSEKMISSGRACRVSVLPMAMPIFFSPKSNASSVSSGMPRTDRQHHRIDAQQLQRRRITVFGGDIEDDVGIGADIEPRILGHFAFE